MVFINNKIVLIYKKSKHLHTFHPFCMRRDVNLNRVNISMLPKYINEGYEFLERLIDHADVVRTEYNVNVSRMKRATYKDYRNILCLTDFCISKFSPYVSTMILHGSCADLKLTEFSDIDTYLVLKRSTISCEKKLKEFKFFWQKSLKRIYRFDCLQHNTHMFATEIDTYSFPYHWFPSQIFRGAVSWLVKDTVCF